MTRSEISEDRADPKRRQWIAALAFPLLFLAAIGFAAVIVRGRPVHLFGAVLVTLVGAALLWVIVSVLWPGRADRTCPNCGKAALERADPMETHGLRCRACGFRDKSASAWLIAEDEGVPLEGIVLAQRDKTGRQRDSQVDTMPALD